MAAVEVHRNLSGTARRDAPSLSFNRFLVPSRSLAIFKTHAEGYDLAQ